jgi:hypothetical protein
MPLRRTVLASVAGQKPGRPKFVRITRVLCLSARRRPSHASALSVIVGSLPGRGRSSNAAIGPFGRGPLNVALRRLIMQAQSVPDRKNRRILSIGQQDPPLRATTRSSAATQPWCSTPRPKAADPFRGRKTWMNSLPYDNFHGIGRLEVGQERMSTASEVSASTDALQARPVSMNSGDLLRGILPRGSRVRASLCWCRAPWPPSCRLHAVGSCLRAPSRNRRI